MGAGLGHPDEVDQVGGRRRPLALGGMVEDPYAGRARVEVDLVAAQDEFAASRPVGHGDDVRGVAQQVLHERPRNADPLAGRLDFGPGFTQQEAGFGVFDEDARLLQHGVALVDDAVGQLGRQQVGLGAKGGEHDQTLPRASSAARTAATAFSA